MPVLTRVLGGATAACSAAIIGWPKLLAKPCGLTDADGGVSSQVRVLIGAIGARDTAIGVAMMIAPPGRALTTALAARVAADAADAIIFGLGYRIVARAGKSPDSRPAGPRSARDPPSLHEHRAVCPHFATGHVIVVYGSGFDADGEQPDPEFISVMTRRSAAPHNIRADDVKCDQRPRAG